MKFRSVPIDEAVGHILGHNIVDDSGRRAFRKGRALALAVVASLKSMGLGSLFVAHFVADDVV